MSEVSTVSTVLPILFLISSASHCFESRNKIGETVDTVDTSDACHLRRVYWARRLRAALNAPPGPHSASRPRALPSSAVFLAFAILRGGHRWSPRKEKKVR